MKKFLILSIVSLLGLFASCSKSTEKENVKLNVLENNITMNVGETKEVKVKVTPEGTSTAGMVWVSSNTNFVTVENGTLKAIAKGESIITVELSGAKTMFRVIVTEKPVEKITLNKEEVEIEIGEKFQLEAKVEPEESTAKVSYESENIEFATVSDNGEISAVKEGTTNIVVKAGDVSVKCKVVVVAPKLKISLDITDITSTNAKIKITPSDKDVKYYYYAMTKSKYDAESKIGVENGEKYGIIDFDKAFAKAQAQMYETKWQDEFYNAQINNNVETTLWDLVNVAGYDSEYVVYAYALDKDGNLVSEFVEKTLKTKPMVKSDNVITVNIKETHKNGVTAEFTATNPNAKYFISLQPYIGFMEVYENDPTKTDLEMAIQLVNVPYTTIEEVPTFNGNITITPDTPGMSVRRKGAKYYIIYFAFDEENGVMSEVYKQEFTTKSE